MSRLNCLASTAVLRSVCVLQYLNTLDLVLDIYYCRLKDYMKVRLVHVILFV